MPCNDITEFITLAVNAKDRLTTYSLHKKSCGKGVGPQAYLVPWIKDRTIQEILHLAPDILLEQVEPKNEQESFLALKHLFALQITLRAFLGQENQDQPAPCTIVEVILEDDLFKVSAYIGIDLVIEKINACTHCSSCHAH